MLRDFLNCNSPTFLIETSDTKSSSFALKTRSLLPLTATHHHHKKSRITLRPLFTTAAMGRLAVQHHSG